MPSLQASLQREKDDDISASDRTGGGDLEMREHRVFSKGTLLGEMLGEQQLP